MKDKVFLSLRKLVGKPPTTGEWILLGIVLGMTMFKHMPRDFLEPKRVIDCRDSYSCKYVQEKYEFLHADEIEKGRGAN